MPFLFPRLPLSFSLLLFGCLTHAEVAMSLSVPAPPRYMGFDFGTSGARVSVIERGPSGLTEIFASAVKYARYDDPRAWREALETLLSAARDADATGEALRRICVSGTSASCLLLDARDGVVTRGPCMYDFDVVSHDGGADPAGVRALEWIDAFVPPSHTARARTGILAKLLRWHAESPLSPREILATQADYLALLLRGKLKKGRCGDVKRRLAVTSDWHNCLKAGYDVRALAWPGWLRSALEDLDADPRVLPSAVVSPGAPAGRADLEDYGIGPEVSVTAGTTDSNAAFFAAAAGAARGTAVTSLGSTLALKVLSDVFVEDAARGVYSHRCPGPPGAPESWLVGGASNVGCRALRAEGFDEEELGRLRFDPETDSPLEYYPLTARGERFPVADPEKEPRMGPRPDERVEHLHGILQGIADVERAGFAALRELGAEPKVHTVWTCGGGGENDTWTRMRERRLREGGEVEKTVTVRKAKMTEASYGAAVLATLQDDCI